MAGEGKYVEMPFYYHAQVGRGAIGTVHPASDEYTARLLEYLEQDGGFNAAFYGKKFAVKRIEDVKNDLGYFVDELAAYAVMKGSRRVVPLLHWQARFVNWSTGQEIRVDPMDLSITEEDLVSLKDPEDALLGAEKEFPDTRSDPMVIRYLKFMAQRLEWTWVETLMTFPMFRGPLLKLHSRMSMGERRKVCASLCRQVVYGLAAFYKRGFSHYDYHMGNILYRRNKRTRAIELFAHDLDQATRAPECDYYDFDMLGVNLMNLVTGRMILHDKVYSNRELLIQISSEQVSLAFGELITLCFENARRRKKEGFTPQAKMTFNRVEMQNIVKHMKTMADDDFVFRGKSREEEEEEGGNKRVQYDYSSGSESD